MIYKTRYIWLNGKFVEWKKANVHILTHALHYGSGVFEGIRFYKTKKNSIIFRLDDHLNRLFNSAKVLKIKIPYSKAQLKKSIINLIKMNKIEEGYIRPIIFYGYGTLGLNPLKNTIDTAILTIPFGKYLPGPVKVKISKFIRLHPKSIIPAAKVCGYYVNSIFALLDAKESGFDEAILLDHRGYIAEGSGENVFIVKKKTIYTPKLGSILPGITRDTVFKIADILKIKLREKDISVEEFKNADEIFLTGTAAEITPVIQVDNKLINKGNVGEITSKIQDTFSKIIRGEIKKFVQWLTFVKKNEA